MGKLNIRKSFKDKKFKFGGYATLLTAIVIAITIAVNLVASQFDLKLDLTSNKMYSLSKQTVDLLKGLKSDIEIIALYETGKENTLFSEILKKYDAKSDRVKLRFVDPVRNPQFTKKYTKAGEEIEIGSLIVASGSKYKVIAGDALVNTQIDQQTYREYPESIAAEQRITGAILYVTSENNPKVFALKGHNEPTLPSYVTTPLGNENYTLEDLELVGGKWEYKKGDVLLIVSPQRDISEDEYNTISSFLADQGRVILMMDFNMEAMPNFQKLLNNQGLNIPKSVIVEGNIANALPNNPWDLVPVKQRHQILDPIIDAKLPVIVPVAQPIEIMNVKKKSLTIEPLLVTSDKAYGKVNPQSQTLEKEEGDLTGPFNVAVAVTDILDGMKPKEVSKVVVLSTSAFLGNNRITASNGGNLDVFMNSLSWLVDRQETISIRPVDLKSEPLNITAAQALTIAAIVVIIIPLVIVISGVMVWLRRRHL